MHGSAPLLATALALALGACGPATTAPSTQASLPHPSPAAQGSGSAEHGSRAQGQSRAPTAGELDAIKTLQRSAERVRELRFLRPVSVVVQDEVAIRAYVADQIEDAELDRARAVYSTLGLLDPQLDVRSMLLNVMGEQVVGYYDPEHKRLAVREDVMRAFDRAAGDPQGTALSEARIVLLHELVHALQDQHLDLAGQIDQERDTDAENAFRALVEGDATLAMIGYLLEEHGKSLSEITRDPSRSAAASSVRGASVEHSELSKAPAIIRVPLLSAYEDGLTFAWNLHGGGGWRAIDRAHSAPPSTTGSILHPERFGQPELPALAMPPVPPMHAANYRSELEDSLGELEMGVYFSQGLAERTARRAAEGWAGDRLRLYRGPQDALGALWLSRWSSPQAAREAKAAAVAVVKRLPAFERARCAVQRRGRHMVIARNLPPDLAEAACRAILDRLGAPN